MKLYDHIVLWNHASLKVLDIRHGRLETGMEMQIYRLPASAFLYVQRGNASVRLDDVLRTMSCNHVLHGGRGARLNILLEVRLVIC
ncbi:hypothetical protein [Paenibacillus sp. NPDC057934]|uniref:hypothetical protein n=1 Tax=Paenibacillus sp. NPDC057934 TaxID=3346282 RepID=UPI0036DCF0D5